MGSLTVVVRPVVHPDGRPMWEVTARIGRMYLTVKSFFREADARVHEASWLGQREAWENLSYGQRQAKAEAQTEA
jgi:hypothetical protein